MTRKQAAGVIDALAEGFGGAASICVHFYGGEPLTNLPAMEAMVERASRKRDDRFTWSITTNGTILSRRVIDLLGRGRFGVVLSIDGPAEIHDRCRRTRRGAPTHARVMRFLEALRSETTCRVRGSSVVRSGWSLTEAFDYLDRLPVDSIKAQAVRGPENTTEGLSPRERRAYLKDLETIGWRIIDDLTAGRVPKDERFSARALQLLAGVRRERFCGAGDFMLGIHPDGGIYPCVLLSGEDNRLGHVSDDPARWRMAGKRWRQSRKPRRECRSCEALPLCGGGCPAILPVCGEDECDLVRKNCEVATAIYDRFRSDPERLLLLAGIS
jgi:uncharacterized protein